MAFLLYFKGSLASRNWGFCCKSSGFTSPQVGMGKSQLLQAQLLQPAGGSPTPTVTSHVLSLMQWCQVEIWFKTSFTAKFCPRTRGSPRNIPMWWRQFCVMSMCWGCHVGPHPLPEKSLLPSLLTWQKDLGTLRSSELIEVWSFAVSSVAKTWPCFWTFRQLRS